MARLYIAMKNLAELNDIGPKSIRLGDMDEKETKQLIRREEDEAMAGVANAASYNQGGSLASQYILW